MKHFEFLLSYSTVLVLAAIPVLSVYVRQCREFQREFEEAGRNPALVKARTRNANWRNQ